MANIRWLLGCAHQLPLIGSLTIASESRGTGPFADARTTPCSLMNEIASLAVISHRVTIHSNSTTGSMLFRLKRGSLYGCVVSSILILLALCYHHQHPFGRIN